MKTLFINKNKHVIVFLFFLAILFATPSNSSEKSLKFAIIPFNVNAEKDLSYLKNGIIEMLASRISARPGVDVIENEIVAQALQGVSGRMNKERALKIGSSVGADLVLFGSLTVFGNSISIDAKVVDISEEKSDVSFFRQAESIDDVIPGINNFARDINEKLFNAKATVASVKEKAIIGVHPENVTIEKKIPETENVQQSQNKTFADSGMNTKFWKSRIFKDRHFKGIATGDVDGDGKIETVVVSDHDIDIFRFEKKRLKKIKKIAWKKYRTILGVDVADVKKNGIAEIFVTCVDAKHDQLHSFVLEWDGKQFINIADNQNWYFRVLPDSKRGNLLFGQHMGIEELFLHEIYELHWQGTKYTSNRKINIPQGNMIFGFSTGDVMNTNKEIVIANRKNLCAYNKSKELEWKSSEEYGGSENSLEYSTDDMYTNRMFLPLRTFITDVDKDGKNEIIAARTYSRTKGYLKNFRSYTEGQFESLSWNGLGLTRNWQTDKISGYISDYTLGDFNNDGKTELIATVVTRHGIILKKTKSALVAYNLNMLLKRDKKTE